jgi:hypothetical protein
VWPLPGIQLAPTKYLTPNALSIELLGVFCFFEMMPSAVPDGSWLSEIQKRLPQGTPPAVVDDHAAKFSMDVRALAASASPCAIREPDV